MKKRPIEESQPLRPARRPFIALIVAEAFSLTGTRLSMIAIPWLVLTTTDSPFLTGLTAAAEMLPYVVAKALGGPLIDFAGARRISVVADTGALLAIALIPALHMFGRLDMFLILPLVFFLGMLRGPADAAKAALVPTVAEQGALAIERVTGAVGMLERTASMLGAAIGGLLVGTIGPASALLVNAVAFALSALVTAWGQPGPPSKKNAEAGAETSPSNQTTPRYGAALKEGWEFLSHEPVLVALTSMVAITNLLDQAMFSVMLPVWAHQSGYTAALFGSLLAFSSAFSVLGAMFATALAPRLPRLATYFIAFLFAGSPRFFVFALGVPLPGIFTVLAIAGFASGFLNPIIMAVMFERIPRELTGRVSSLTLALSWALMPLGSLLGGALVMMSGLGVSFVLLGTTYFATTMLPLAFKSFKAIGKRPPPNTEHNSA